LVCNAVCNFPTFTGGGRRMPISRLSVTSCVGLELRPLPSTGVTRCQRYYGPLRHPRRPGLSLAGVRLRVTRPHRMGFPCCVRSPFTDMPSSIPRWPAGPWSLVGWTIPTFPVPSGGGLPQTGAGSATTLDVSRPAQRSLALRPVGSPSRLSDPFVSKAPTVSLPPPPLR